MGLPSCRAIAVTPHRPRSRSQAAYRTVLLAAAIAADPAVSHAQQHPTSPGPQRALAVVLLGTGPTAPDARPPGGAASVRLQHAIDSTQLPFRVASAGRYGESSAYAAGRVDSLIAKSMDVFVIETG